MATKITTPKLFNLSSNNTAATQLPVFTTSTRPTPTASTVQVEYLVIGGGGAGGGWGGGGGAGGYLTNYGASKISLTSSVDYAIAVGEGGVKQANSGTRVAANPGEDSSIIGTGISVVADGGGGGGTMIFGSSTTEYPAQNGGSGGGASAMRNVSSGGSGTTGQGEDGGNSPAQDPNFPGGGGGGGASSVGGDGQSASGSPAYAAGNGGDGEPSSITGTSITRAGGGGGFTYGVSVTNVSSGGTGGGGAGGRYVSSGNAYNPSPSNAVDGQVNTGSGGGSGSVTKSGSGSSWYGGDTASGGSGIVILRYPTNSSPVIKTTGSLVYTQSTDGSDTVIQFTEGSGNVSFASAGITVGEMIFNSTTEKVEYWDGFQWNMIKDEDTYAPSLKMYLNASDTASYPGTGTTWFDLTSNNNNGTINGANWNPGGYFNFDGSNDDVSGTGFTPSLTDVQTVNYWVRNSTISSPEVVMSIGQTGNSNAYSWINFAYDNTGTINGSYGITNGGISNKTITNSAYVGNTWYNVCFLVFPENRGTSSQCFKIYIDGSEVAVTDSTGSGTLPTVQGYPIIGRYSGQSILRFSGDLSKIRIFNTRITEAEITALYNEGE